jgi:hypothetical protein
VAAVGLLPEVTRPPPVPPQAVRDTPSARAAVMRRVVDVGFMSAFLESMVKNGWIEPEQRWAPAQ